MSAPSRGGLGRRGTLLLGGLLLALVAFIAWTRFGQDTEPEPPGGPPDLLARIPAGAFVVADVDVATLRQTELGAELFGGERDVVGLGTIGEVCGFDPVAELRRVALVVPQLGDVGFGLFAEGPIDVTRVASCAEAIIQRRGGRPERSSRGAFTVLRDAALGADAAAVAIAPGGPLMLGEPAYLEQGLAVATGEAGLAPSGAHRRLRTLVPPGIVVATVVLGPAQRQTLAEELRAQGLRRSPLTSLREAALSVSIDADLGLEVVVGCADALACRELATLVEARRADVQRDPRVRLLGLDATVASAVVATEGPRLRLSVRVPVAVVLTVLRRLQMLQRLEEVDLRPSAPAPSAPVPSTSAVPPASVRGPSASAPSASAPAPPMP